LGTGKEGGVLFKYRWEQGREGKDGLSVYGSREGRVYSLHKLKNGSCCKCHKFDLI